VSLQAQLEKKLHRLRARRRRLRWLLKKLPRKANVGRYPGLKRFADAARKRPWLWSFKRPQILPAVYVGTVLSLMPTYGIQFVIAFGAAMLFRANLTVMAGLQLITNPLTAAPIYLFTDWLGMWIIGSTGYGEGLNSVGTHFNALVLGGVVAGLVLAFLVDLLWRLLAWETRHFSRQLARLRSQASTTPPES
jgi:uncharacterized protein (DUF2062 family)